MATTESGESTSPGEGGGSTMPYGTAKLVRHNQTKLVLINTNKLDYNIAIK